MAGLGYVACRLVSHSPSPGKPMYESAESPESLFNQAFSGHQSGKLDIAEAKYRRVLELAPNHTDARHMYGVICLQKGDPVAGEYWIQSSIQLNASFPPAHNNLGMTLEPQGRLAEAEAAKLEAEAEKATREAEAAKAAAAEARANAERLKAENATSEATKAHAITEAKERAEAAKLATKTARLEVEAAELGIAELRGDAK